MTKSQIAQLLILGGMLLGAILFAVEVPGFGGGWLLGAAFGGAVFGFIHDNPELPVNRWLMRR